MENTEDATDMEDIQHQLEVLVDMVDHQLQIQRILERVEHQITIEIQEVLHQIGKII